MSRWSHLDDWPKAPAPIPLLVMVERSRDVDFEIARLVDPHGPNAEKYGPCPTCGYSGHYLRAVVEYGMRAQRQGVSLNRAMSDLTSVNLVPKRTHPPCPHGK